MSKAVFITARLGSARLPKKHLLKILDKHCIEYVIERAKRVNYADRVVLCTTTLDEDDALCDIAKKRNISFFRGSVEDVLVRWFQAARKYDVDFFVTANADNLFCEPELMDLAFKQYSETGIDFIDWEGFGLLVGAFTYGIKVSALEKICKNKTIEDTEMTLPFFLSNKEIKIEKLKNVPPIFINYNIRATLDYKEDYIFFKTVIEHFGDNYFSLRSVINFLKKHPTIVEINQFRNFDWKQNQNNKIRKITKEI